MPPLCDNSAALTTHLDDAIPVTAAGGTRMIRLRDWLRGNDAPAGSVPRGFATAAGVVFTVYAAAQPLAPGLANLAVVLLLILYLLALLRGAARMTPVTLAVLLFYAVYLAVNLCNPPVRHYLALRLYGQGAMVAGDPLAAAGLRHLGCLLDWWHLLILPASLLWAFAGWRWWRRAAIALALSSGAALAASYWELATQVNFRWDILGPAMKRWDMLWLIGRETVPRLPENRVMGFFDHPLTYGGFLAAVTFVFAGLALYGRGDGRGKKSRGLFAFMAGAGALMLLLAKNRSYWMGAAPGAIILLRWKSRRMLIGLMAAAAALAVIGYAASPALRGRANGLFSFSQNDERVAFWNSGRDMVFERPLAGWGVCGYRMYGAPFRERHALKPLSNFTHVHSSYLQVAVEGGLLLAAAFLALLGALLWRLWRVANGALPEAAALARGALAALGCFMVAALFEYNFGDKEPSMTLLFLLGAALHLPAAPRLVEKGN